MEYTISKEKGSNRYYVHRIGDKTPILYTYGTKKQALHKAAYLNGVSYKEYLKLRKQDGSDEDD
jgi:hypothetical protein